ncbi:alpha/beta-Hydrolases superfamily protein [Actinidia rufa]|uniref:Alpha/beta-Hydrolases superfamily protein n=1 Tax=Actinidia rufa TaxID=165716 RepID=A0A7J0E0A0_9ERIC|nr:alpha/beta-Hydrolases superfamily protein [Actinidia rufa]
MAEEVSSSSAAGATATTTRRRSSTRSLWPSVLRWIPTSTDHIIASEKRLLSLLKTPYAQEQVNIGSGPPGSKTRWFRSASDEPRFINTVTFDSKEDSPTLVMVHGYAASQGFFFRNFDALAKHFKVIAIDQLGVVGASLETLVFCRSIPVNLASPIFIDAAGADQAGLTLHAKALKVVRVHNAAPCDHSKNRHADEMLNAMKDVVKPFLSPIDFRIDDRMWTSYHFNKVFESLNTVANAFL